MDKLRFSRFSDSELYIIKRAFIEASKYIYMEDNMNYSEEELDLFDKLLAEAIDNIKIRETVERNVLKYIKEKNDGMDNTGST